MKFGTQPRVRLISTSDVVLIANDVGGRGGMEQQLARLVAGILDDGLTLTVIARSCAVEPRPRLRFVRIPGPSRPFALAFPLFFVLASAQMLRHRGRVRHATGAIVFNRVDVSTVHYCHTGTAQRLGLSRAKYDSAAYRANAAVAAWLSRLGERVCYRPSRTGHLCAVSAGLAAELGDSFPAMRDRVSAIPNGVDTELYRPDPRRRAETRARFGIEATTPVALFVGGDWERKGLWYVVEAIGRLPSWHLLVAGDGDQEQLSREAASRHCDGRVHALGQVSAMAPIYAAADALVLPTAYETFSLVTYEAAASGLPLVVAKASGIEDVVRQGVNGWFVQRDAEAIVARLSELEGSSSRREEMGRAARVAAQGFSWEEMRTGYRTVYAGFGLARAAGD